MRRNNPRRDFGSQRHSLSQNNAQGAVTDTCAGCGDAITFGAEPWVITASRKIVHYGGTFGQACLRKLMALT